MTPARPRPDRVLVAPDKFRGTATAREAAAALAAGIRDAGATPTMLPLADGGEGTVDAFGGIDRWVDVTGPLGRPVRAGFNYDVSARRAVIAMADAAGLDLAGGAQHNDPVAATTRGVGELIRAAVDAGAREILVGLGGSATTDGGAGALEVLAPNPGTVLLPPDVALTVLADVTTGFLDAAMVFGPQKGADERQIRLLSARLAGLADDYERRFGIDVRALPRSGAAGGLAGGLAAIGATLVDGAAAVAEAVGLDQALAGVDLVITGEGRFDDTSLVGKTVGHVLDRARAHGVPAVVIVGAAEPAAAADVRAAGGHVIDLVGKYGREAAFAETAACLTAAARSLFV